MVLISSFMDFLMNRISVIIPAYNAEKTLPRALGSVFDQRFPPYEIIVVNDGSTDCTEQVLAPCMQRIRYLKQPNGGASLARNAGAAVAQGELLAFLDADDYWHPDKLELQRQVFVKFPDAVLCWSEPRIEPEENISILQTWSATSPMVQGEATRRVFNDIFKTPYLGTPNVLVKRSAFSSAGGFDVSFRTAEDLDLWLRIAYEHPIYHLPVVLCLVLRQAQSLSSRLSEQIYSDHLAVIDKFCTAHPDFAQREKSLVAGAKSLVLEHWGSTLLGKRNFPLARSVLFKSLMLELRVRPLYLFVKSVIRK